MSQTNGRSGLRAGAAASLLLALLASSPVAVADSTEPSSPDAPSMEQSAEQPKAAPPVSVPEALKSTALLVTGLPATPALMLQSTAYILNGIAATPAQILQGAASALSAAGVK